MKFGTFATALIKYTDEVGMTPFETELKHVYMVIHDNGFAEICYYAYGNKEPNNKRTMVIPASSIINFIGYGYAN